MSTVALSDSVKPIYFFIVLADFFDYANSCCISSLEIKVLLEDWSGIFELTVLIRRIDYLRDYDLENDDDRNCVVIKVFFKCV